MKIAVILNDNDKFQETIDSFCVEGYVVKQGYKRVGCLILDGDEKDVAEIKQVDNVATAYLCKD